MIDTINSSMNQDTDFNPIIEYIPFMSTIHAIKALFDKATHLPSMSPQSIAKSRYYSHVSSTSYTRQLTLMIPILGNLIIYLYDKSRKNLIERTSLHQHHSSYLLYKTKTAKNGEDTFKKQLVRGAQRGLNSRFRRKK